MRIFASCFDKIERFFDCNKSYIDKLYTCSQFDLNRSKRFKNAEFYKNICKLF